VIPQTLEDAIARLEPLTLEHATALAATDKGDRSSFVYTWVPDGLAESIEYIEFALRQQASDNAVPYAVVDVASGEVVGSTRLWDFVRFDPESPWPEAVELGYTWYAPHVQRTGLNTAAKRLLLTHVFEDWSALRVTLKTDARNDRSRLAIERLGALFEGVRRVLPATPSGRRDVAYYSIIRDEWPAVKARLEGFRAPEVRAGR
jgi:RimJ/RimL family protein N-acetyltransferase